MSVGNGGYPADFRGRKYLDAPYDLKMEIIETDISKATPEDAFNCVVAQCLRRNGYPALVQMTVTLVLTPASEEDIEYNRALNGEGYVEGISPGDVVLMRFINGRELQRHLRLLDDQGPSTLNGSFANEFELTEVVLLAPTHHNRVRRDKRSGTRKQRKDNRRDKKPVQYTRTWRRLDRTAQAQHLIRGK